MKSSINRKWFMGVMLAGMVFVVPAHAAKHGQPGMGPGTMGGPQGPGMQQMSGMMHDMSGQMRTMTDQMGRCGADAAMQKQMTERMRDMSQMMEQMSGMMGRGMMMDGDMQQRMDRMRMQMDEMKKAPPAAPKK